MAEAEPRLAPEAASPSPAAEGEEVPCPGPKQIIESYIRSLMKHHREVVATGGVEPIHRMRVTTRKLQAVLDFLVMKPDEARIRSLKKELRRWRRQLSRVRNYDVFLEMIRKRLSAKKPVHLQECQLIAEELTRRRAEMARDLQTRFKEIDLVEFASRLGIKFEATEPSLSSASNGQLITEEPNERAALLFDNRSAIAERAEQRLLRRLREFENLAAKVTPSDRPDDIHQLRIAGKRLRYSVEVASRLGYGKAERASAWLKRLQDELGDLHDIDSFEDEIADIVGRRDFIRKHMAESGKMLHAASRVVGKRHAMARKALPARAPSFVPSTVLRLVRRLSDDVHPKA